MELHGGAMGAVLGALGDLGYGLAYRVLDAQHFGVPQRRRRVVIAGCLGDWAASAAVLLEPEGVPGDPAPSRAAGAGTAGGAAVGTLQGGGKRGYRVDAESAAGGHLIAGAVTGKTGGADENDAAVNLLVPNVAATLAARNHKGSPTSSGDGFTLVGFDAAQITSGENRSRPEPGDPQPPLAATGQPHVAYTLRADPGGTGQGHNTDYVSHALTAEGSDASEDGTGRGMPLVPVAFGHTNGLDPQASEDDTPTMRAGHFTGGGAVMESTAVRRLTPVECERLQGYPDGWTATSGGRPQSDSARYRQLGNSIAVPVFAWVVRRIVAYEAGELP